MKRNMRVTLEPPPISETFTWSRRITGAMFARLQTRSEIIFRACRISIFISLAVTRRPSPSPPKGEITQYVFDQSKIFPGTTRNYWIYTPAQYDPSKPACLLVDQDGDQFKAPEVLNQLIAAGRAVTIAVFVTPGRVKALSPNALDRFNRSVEYDGLGDDYVRFLVEELLPDVEKQKTSDGRPIRLSHAATDRAIMGSSSGAIAAFTAAWERPDQFSRVFSAIGTYVNQRGGNIYPSLFVNLSLNQSAFFCGTECRPDNPRAVIKCGQPGNGEWSATYAGYEVNCPWGTGDR